MATNIREEGWQEQTGLRLVVKLGSCFELVEGAAVSDFRLPFRFWDFRVYQGNPLSIEGRGFGIEQAGRKVTMSVFDEKYRVVGVESDRLLVRGVHSGDMLTIVNSEPEVPLSAEEYPVGKLIALTDPAGRPEN